MTNVLFSSGPAETAAWAPMLRRIGAELGVAFELQTDPGAIDPAAVDVLVLNPIEGLRDLRPYGGVKAIQSIWAGVESYLANPTLPTAPPLCRMVVSGLTEGMTDYIVGHVLARHLDIQKHVRQSAGGLWAGGPPPLSRDRTVGVLGLGALGQDAVERLSGLRFNVIGWSRSQKTIPGVDCRAGPEGLREVLSRAEILAILLPLTKGTHHILNAEALSLLPPGASIINAGRGQMIDDDALLAALDDGRVGHATLDVFDVEPLPGDHPFWRREDVTITPHIAAETRADDAARFVVEQISRLQAGAGLLHIVDRGRGY